MYCTLLIANGHSGNVLERQLTRASRSTPAVSTGGSLDED